MNNVANTDLIELSGNLTLIELSDKKFPNVKSYQEVKAIDLQKLESIDSAGIAYIAQIKSQYPELCFTGVSDKTNVLAELYGLSFLFKS